MVQTNLFAQIAEATQAPASPKEEPATPITFSNIGELLHHCNKVGTKFLSYSEYINMRTQILAQELKIKSILNSMTISELKKYVHTWHSNPKKSELIDKGVSGIIAYFLCDKSVSYSPFDGETYEGQRAKILQAITEQEYNTYTIAQDARRAEKEAAKQAREAAVTNPVTLEDYQLIVKMKGIEALTPEQREICDYMVTDKNRAARAAKQAQNNVVTAVEVSEGLQMEIKTSHHAKKNIPLWVVVLSSRIDSAQFAELKDRAHKLGGYYSSFRGSGAIPGFTFESVEGAEMFTKVIAGNVDSTELKEQTEEERQQQRAETLEEKAARIADEANDSLNRDRKANTHKRAAEAASAERQAIAQLQLSQIMQRIAARIKEGNIKYLDKVQNITEVETLLNILSAAKWKHINTDKIDVNRNEYEYTNVTPLHVVFPCPSFYAENAIKDIMTVQYESGKKLAAARLMKGIKKMVKGETIYYCSTTQEIEDYETVFCDYSTRLDKYTRESYSKGLMRYKRITRLNLLSLPELRAAIRELITIVQNVEITPEQKKQQEIRELERKFINTQIDGFFPTPKLLASEVVDKADIQEGHAVLEPSAGLGHLAEVIRDQHGDNIKLECVEHHTGLHKALQLKGFTAHCADFTTFTGEYDRIVMNPPFEEGQDIEHVQHAYKLLKPGGRIVAIMAANKRNNSSKSKQFIQWLNEVGGVMEDNPAGAFLSSFRPTGVNTVTVVIDK
jgi:phospholipid N-methyltransferase